MVLVSNLKVLFVSVLLCFCWVNGQQRNCEQNGGVVEDYIKSEVKRQVELMKEDVIKAEVEKQVEEKLNKHVKEEVEKELENVREGNSYCKYVFVYDGLIYKTNIVQH